MPAPENHPLLALFARLRGRPLSGLQYRHLGRTLMLSVGVGLAAGLVAAGFHVGTEWLQYLALGTFVHLHTPSPHGEHVITPEVPGGDFRRWAMLIVPALGALVSGVLVWAFAPEAEGGGGDAFIDAFHYRKSLMRRRLAPVKMVASILILGSGGSAGREGPIMQMSAAVGSFLGRTLRLSERERRQLLVAGVAAGMAAIFRTPLGASIFAIEVLYRDDFEADAIVPSVIASVTAYSVFISLFGAGHLFATAIYPFSPAVLPLYLAMAVVVSLSGRLFVFMLHGSKEHIWERLHTPRWLKPAIGGLAVGALATVVPAVAGMGYGWLQDAILWIGAFPPAWRTVGILAGIALAKMVATSCTIASGGSGGDFGPSLVIGGLVGAACGQTFHLLLPSMAIHPGSFALVGMATFFGGIAHVPLGSLIMVTELTGSYDLLVPLMFTEGLAMVLLRDVKLYHAQVPSQAVSPAHADDLAIDVLATLAVADAYDRGLNCEPVEASLPLRDFLGRVAESAAHVFPVVDPKGEIVGLVSFDAVRAILGEDVSDAPMVVADAMKPRATLTAEEPLSTALDRLLSSGVRQLPVVDGKRVVGAIGFDDIIRAYQRELDRRRHASG